MQNQTLIQYFHWYYNESDTLWNKATKEAANLHVMGFTGLWFPPAYKGSNGGYSVGYDAYDLYDLGEFDQKGGINTKYGSKAEYIQAIKSLHEQQIMVLADTVFNQKAAGDELEKVKVRKVNPLNREEYISDVYEIEAWTKFTFKGRNGKYSDMIWDYHCFSGVDWDESQKEKAIYAIQNHFEDPWENTISKEFGNYDYLMFNDIDFRNEAVRNDLNNWGKWYYETCGVDGFRLDAAKHIAYSFMIEWVDFMKVNCKRDFFFIAENWNIKDANELERYIEITGGRAQLFDSLLHQNLYVASHAGNSYEMNRIFENTLVHRNPELAITFVDNHDTQPLQALDSYVDFWFRPLAYGLIMLREQGIPCVFYTDIYGASYQDKEQQIDLVPVAELPLLLSIRAKLAYGSQIDYLDHPNCIGWTRAGDQEHENSGIAVLLSNGDAGYKFMEIGKGFAGKTFVDLLGKRKERVVIDENGCAEFFCNAGSISVWGIGN